MSIFARMIAGLVVDQGATKIVMIDAIYLKAHRTAIRMGVNMSADA